MSLEDKCYKLVEQTSCTRPIQFSPHTTVMHALPCPLNHHMCTVAELKHGCASPALTSQIHAPCRNPHCTEHACHLHACLHALLCNVPSVAHLYAREIEAASAQSIQIAFSPKHTNCVSPAFHSTLRMQAKRSSKTVMCSIIHSLLRTSSKSRIRHWYVCLRVLAIMKPEQEHMLRAA